LLLAPLLRGLRDGSADPPDLLVVGDGPERDRLTAELSALGLADHAVLTGHLSDPDHVQDALRGVDLVVLMSEAEGLPQVLVQSAAAGTPFVAFDVEGVREVLALGARGSAVPLGRLDAVVDAAQRWLRTGADHGETPPVDLSSWSPDSIAASYRAAFGGVLGMAPAPARELLSASG
jgi:glycosyltransferase involved in cell wall biosynthesis